MSTLDAVVEVVVEELKDVRAGEGGVVLDTVARVDGERHDTSIEVAEADTPAVAAALVNPVDVAGSSTGGAHFASFRCLAVGVVETTVADSVRLHLQFDSGQVMPVVMSADAARALMRGLRERLGP